MNKRKLGLLTGCAMLAAAALADTTEYIDPETGEQLDQPAERTEPLMAPEERIQNDAKAQEQEGRMAGYYTLAAGGVLLAEMPEQIAKRLPRYPSVPVARLGRLAVDQVYRGRKLGAVLPWDAVMRALRSEVAVFALMVDAKDEQAEAFYRHHGFATFGSLPPAAVTSAHGASGQA
jgi:GNAT superfamily N-acetyltransferase